MKKYFEKLSDVDLAMIRFLVAQAPTKATLRAPLEELYGRVVDECNRRNLQLDQVLKKIRKKKKKRKHK